MALYNGGNGLSKENAIIILGAKNEFEALKFFLFANSRRIIKSCSVLGIYVGLGDHFESSFIINNNMNVIINIQEFYCVVEG